MKKRKNRWYDKYERLAKVLEAFKEIPGFRRNKLIAGVHSIMQQDNPGLMEEHVLEFPLETDRRRWYDKDPSLWLLFNSLRFSDTVMLKKVTMYLESSPETSKN